MKLEKLEIENYRSIKNQWNEDRIELDGLDCLVGKNNVGKTNIISSIKYLLEKEDKPNNDELYWNGNTSLTVKVRGYFKVSKNDLKRVEDEKKREEIKDILLSHDNFEEHLGITRITQPKDEGGRSIFKLIQLRPIDDRLNEDSFDEFHSEQWNKISDEDSFTKSDYRNAMLDEYPKLGEHVDDGKLNQKRAWKIGYQEYVASKPKDIDYEPKPTEFPTGTKGLVRDKILPDVVKIPAVKGIEDATQASGEFGEMINALSDEIQEEIDEQIHDKLDDIYSQLDSESKELETQISKYLKEAFENHSVEIDFPRLKSRQLFRDAKIRIDDKQLEMDTLSAKNVGEGVRRVLIFSMLRTIADIRNGKSPITESSREKNDHKQPLLILYEEAELFLHPNLQKILLRVFKSLSDGEAQVIFNTHSPILVQNRIIDTINIVRNQTGTKVTQFHTVLTERAPREQSRLMDLQKVSSYIFADKVVLVEGDSDEIVLRELSPVLDSDWRFESQGIPVLSVGGKGDLPLFKAFLEELGIDVFVMVDIDALEQTVDRLVGDGSPSEKIQELRDTATSLIEDGEVEQSWNRSDVDSHIDSARWDKTFDRFKQLEEILEDGGSPEEEHVQSLKKLTNLRAKDGWREAITSDHERINSERMDLRSQILNNDILILNGEIEDYYPDIEVSNKTEAALKFSAEDYDTSELRRQFVDLQDRSRTDMEVFLNRIFPIET